MKHSIDLRDHVCMKVSNDFIIEISSSPYCVYAYHGQSWTLIAKETFLENSYLPSAKVIASV